MYWLKLSPLLYIIRYFWYFRSKISNMHGNDSICTETRPVLVPRFDYRRLSSSETTHARQWIKMLCEAWSSSYLVSSKLNFEICICLNKSNICGSYPICQEPNPSRLWFNSFLPWVSLCWKYESPCTLVNWDRDSCQISNPLFEVETKIS